MRRGKGRDRRRTGKLEIECENKDIHQKSANAIYGPGSAFLSPESSIFTSFNLTRVNTEAVYRVTAGNEIHSISFRSLYSNFRCLFVLPAHLSSKPPFDPPSPDSPEIQVSQAWSDLAFCAANKAEVLVGWLIGPLWRDEKRCIHFACYFVSHLDVLVRDEKDCEQKGR